MEELKPGAYGCVYRPAFKCREPKAYPDEKYISKVMRAKSEKKERKTYEALNMRSIDPEMKYYLGEPEVCTLENPMEYYQVKKKCKITTPFKILNYIDGGDNLITILKRRPHYIHTLQALENIFKGLVVMHANECYHLDIKPSNIVLKNNLCRLVDLGLSRTLRSKITNLYLFGFQPPKYVYPYWPIELSQLTRTPPILDLEYYSEYYDALSTTMDNVYHIKRIPIKTIDYIQTELNAMSITDRKKIIYERADVWALGITLYDIYHSIPMLQSTLRSKLFDFIPTLLKINVFERPNARDALLAYQTFLSELELELT